MNPLAAVVAARVHRLADTLTVLREQVRIAVAGELATALGTTVRDLLVAALTGGPGHRCSGPYPDDADEWDDDPWDESEEEPDTRQFASSPPPAKPDPSTGSAAALTVCWSLARRWREGSGSPVVAAGIGLIAGLLAKAGGPLAKAGLAALSAATELWATAGRVTSPPLSNH